MGKTEAMGYLINYYKAVKNSRRDLQEAKKNLGYLDKLGFNVEEQQEKMQKMFDSLCEFEHSGEQWANEFLRNHFEK